jgi:hypothetical protein
VPLYDNDGTAFPLSEYSSLQTFFAEKFKGVTVYQRAPAKGLWKENEDSLVRDDLIIFEVVARNLDRRFWINVRTFLEKKFKQEIILIRSWSIEIL